MQKTDSGFYTLKATNNEGYQIEVLQKECRVIATKDEDLEFPEGTFSTILRINKDVDTPMHEGDMLGKAGRSATRCTSCLWLNSADGTVPVPYNISSGFSSGDINLIKNAMAEFETLTCVRFVPRTTESNYIIIVSNAGCSSFIGKTGGRQTVSFGRGCLIRGIIQHELDHALGFYHEHARSDRDSYITINYPYISKEYWGDFDKQDTNNLGLEYDYGSVMHYNAYAFSSTVDQRSIITKPDPTVPIGQTIGLSNLDISKINRLYQCTSACANLLGNQSGVFTSANYPSPYPDNTNCVWLIRTPSGKASLTFQAFDVQSTTDCTSDYMRIYDGPTKKSNVLLEKKCGRLNMPQVIASTSQMLVEFVSDGAIAGVGFKATYSSVPCGGTFFTFQGNFTSPGYPDNYGANMDCAFSITAPVGYMIALTINDFQLESSLYCIHDYLTIVADGRQRGQYCGSIGPPKIIYTTGNSMSLTFHSDISVQMKGFQASYTFY